VSEAELTDRHALEAFGDPSLVDPGTEGLEQLAHWSLRGTQLADAPVGAVPAHGRRKTSNESKAWWTLPRGTSDSQMNHDEAPSNTPASAVSRQVLDQGE
jgi:hypothetical protein